MIKNEHVLEIFAMLTGITAEDAARWSALLSAAKGEILGRVRPDADVEECEAGICQAIAALAYYRYTLIAEDMGETAFKAGEVSLSFREGGSRAAKLIRDEALAALSDILEDRQFQFKAVGQ